MRGVFAVNIEVRYFSRSGNTKKLAYEIAKSAGIYAKSIGTPLKYSTDILFIGGALYGGTIDQSLKDYIKAIPKGMVKTAAVFSTSAKTGSAFKIMRKALEERDISVMDEDFYCKGKFMFFNRRKPDADDLKNAFEFGDKILNKIEISVED